MLLSLERETFLVVFCGIFGIGFRKACALSEVRFWSSCFCFLMVFFWVAVCASN